MAKSKPPSYRWHKARNCAVVTIAGKDHYLGEYNSPDSWELYHRLVAEHFANRRELPPPQAPAPALTITELIARYWRFAKTYYVKNGNPTSEIHAIKLALRFVRRLYAHEPAVEFSPLRLKAVREAMITHEIVRQAKSVDPETGQITVVRRVCRIGMARKSINKLIGRVRRMFAWAVEEELLDVGVHAALLRVKGLKKGKSLARETARVQPVPAEHIEKILEKLPPLVRIMVEVQRLCGCRPQDIVQMRPLEIDTRGAIWEYRPHRHKTEHHNEDGNPDLDRIVYLGPKAQQLLAPLLGIEPTEYLFSPRRAETERFATRKEPKTQHQNIISATPRNRRVTESKRIARSPLRPYYPVGSHRQAIRRACVRAGVTVWVPNQLRHTRLTEIRKNFGLEASRVCGGHREVRATQIYAEQDRDLARHVMAETG